MVKQKRKKKNCVEVNGKRSTRLNADEEKGMVLMRTKARNVDLKWMRTLNGGSVNRKDLNETDGENANGNRVRRLNGRNEKDLEIESGSCGVMRTVETKQIQWADECDNWQDRGCVLRT